MKPINNQIPDHETIMQRIEDMFGSRIDYGKELGTQDQTSTISSPKSVSSQGISQQNFNPGNLIYAGQYGAVKGDPKGDGTYWAKFPNEQAGFQGLQNDIQAKLDKNPKMTVAQLLDLRSPPSENNTSSLHYNVMDDLADLNKSGKISTLMANQLPVSEVPMDRLSQAIAKAEGYYNTNSQLSQTLPNSPSTPQNP